MNINFRASSRNSAPAVPHTKKKKKKSAKYNLFKTISRHLSGLQIHWFFSVTIYNRSNFHISPLRVRPRSSSHLKSFIVNAFSGSCYPMLHANTTTHTIDHTFTFHITYFSAISRLDSRRSTHQRHCRLWPVDTWKPEITLFTRCSYIIRTFGMQKIEREFVQQCFVWYIPYRCPPPARRLMRTTSACLLFTDNNEKQWHYSKNHLDSRNFIVSTNTGPGVHRHTV